MMGPGLPASNGNGQPGRAAAGRPAAGPGNSSPGNWGLVRPAARAAGVLFGDLTEPERLVCAAFPDGSWADLRDLPRREVRAGVLRALLLGAGDVRPGQAPAARLRGAHITGQLDLTGAAVPWPLALEDCDFSAVACLADVTAGTVSFAGSRLPGLDGTRLRLAGTLDLRGCRITGTLDLRQARLGLLHDDPGCWPGELRLDGLTYQALEPALPARQRLQWLARDSGGPQPYEQLAAHYRGVGEPAQARVARQAGLRWEHRRMTMLPRLWGIVQDVTTGYGCQPWRAVVWLAALLAAGSAVFTLSPPAAVLPGAAPRFSAFLYTLDLLLPVGDFGQQRAFQPAGAGQWFACFLVAAGWLLAAAVAAAAARSLARR